MTVKLLAQACLEISCDGFKLLTDPWLASPALLGAWAHYPPLAVEVSTLHPDAVWVSHEHSDHFHIPTLVHFDRSTPVYVPDCPNRRLVAQLDELGFANVQPTSFGRTYHISGRIKITCFEPGSLWNDAIVLMEIDGFRILNINDAGLKYRIPSLVKPVDVVASAFSPGASAYPSTWTHLTESQKISIMERARKGLLEMLKRAMDLYGGRYLLPFVSHFILWHPSHREYTRTRRRNTVDDVVRAFEGNNVRDIDLLPGEGWEVATGHINRIWENRDQPYEADNKLRHVEQRFKPDDFKNITTTYRQN